MFLVKGNFPSNPRSLIQLRLNPDYIHLWFLCVFLGFVEFSWGGVGFVWFFFFAKFLELCGQ